MLKCRNRTTIEMIEIFCSVDNFRRFMSFCIVKLKMIILQQRVVKNANIPRLFDEYFSKSSNVLLSFITFLMKNKCRNKSAKITQSNNGKV